MESVALKCPSCNNETTKENVEHCNRVSLDEGDLTVCNHCVTICVLHQDGLRKITDSEKENVIRNNPGLWESIVTYVICLQAQRSNYH